MDSDTDPSLGTSLEDESLRVLIRKEFERSSFDSHDFLPHDRIDKLITRLRCEDIEHRSRGKLGYG
jgi:hypothetical protein